MSFCRNPFIAGKSKDFFTFILLTVVFSFENDQLASAEKFTILVLTPAVILIPFSILILTVSLFSTSTSTFAPSERPKFVLSTTLYTYLFSHVFEVEVSTAPILDE